jgi:hypothetical protein
MPYPSTPCGRATPETASQFHSLFLPVGHPMPYAYDLPCLVSKSPVVVLSKFPSPVFSAVNFQSSKAGRRQHRRRTLTQDLLILELIQIDEAKLSVILNALVEAICLCF